MVLDEDLDRAGRDAEDHVGELPECGDAEDVGVEVAVAHAAKVRAGRITAKPVRSGLPTRKPEDPYSFPQTRSIRLDQNYLFDVGAYTASPSYYGTFDQRGNAYNWNDLDGRSSPLRGLRGGFFFAGAPSVQSTTFSQATPAREEADTGFRLASPD